MMNNNHISILEGLSNNRKAKSGKIYESVNRSVLVSLEKFYKKERTPSQVKKKINNILNTIYFFCNDIGSNRFTGGTTDYSKNGNQPIVDVPKVEPLPSIVETIIQIEFLEDVDIDIERDNLFKQLEKDSKDNFLTIEIDPFSIDMCINEKEDSKDIYAISIENCQDGFIVRVAHQKDPSIKEEYSSIRYFRGEKPWDKYKFEFTKSDNIDTPIKVSVTNEYWDSSDYAYIDTAGNVNSITSYSPISAKTVRKALQLAHYSSRDFEDITRKLHIDEELDLHNSEFIGKKKSYSEMEDEEEQEEGSEKEKSEKKSKDREGTDGKEDTEDDAEESSTGVFGTEIGLSIDKENCESTGVAGVSTPTGVLNPRRKVVEGMDSEDTKDLTIICPECGSQSINIRDSHVFHCSRCGYEWELTHYSNRDTALDNTEDEPALRTIPVGDTNNIYTNPKSDYRFN